MGTKIIILLDSSSFGGIESHVFELARELRIKGENVTITFMKDISDHPLYAKLSAQDIPYYCIKSLSDLFTYFKSHKPHVIHTHGYKAGIVGRAIANWNSIKCVSTFHAGEKLSGKLAFYDWIDRKSAFLADQVFSVSTSISRSIGTPNKVMRNFICTRSTKISRGNRLAFVGRLSHEKGPDLLVEIARLKTQHQFHFYGNGPLSEKLKNRASPNIIFHGQVNNMEHEWSEIELLLITSRNEGLPMVAIEAMARGIPVIAFDVGELHSLIDNETNGWLIEQGNITCFLAAISNWKTFSEKRKNDIRASAILKVNTEFSSTAVVPQYQEIYNTICLEKAGA